MGSGVPLGATELGVPGESPETTASPLPDPLRHAVSEPVGDVGRARHVRGKRLLIRLERLLTRLE